jgi:hypothetical protein
MLCERNGHARYVLLYSDIHDHCFRPEPYESWSTAALFPAWNGMSLIVLDPRAVMSHLGLGWRVFTLLQSNQVAKTGVVHPFGFFASFNSHPQPRYPIIAGGIIFCVSLGLTSVAVRDNKQGQVNG